MSKVCITLDAQVEHFPIDIVLIYQEVPKVSGKYLFCVLVKVLW